MQRSELVDILNSHIQPDPLVKENTSMKKKIA